MRYPESQIGPSSSNLMNIKFGMSKKIYVKAAVTKLKKKWEYQQKHARHAILTCSLQCQCSLSFFEPI